MGWKKGNPGCPCCSCPTEDCELYHDDFSSDTIANYSAESGSWSIGSGVVSTGDANAVLLWNTDAGEQHSVSVILVPPSIASNQDVFRIILGWADSSNYLYARIRWNGVGGFLSLREVIGGVDSQIKAETFISKNANDTSLVLGGGTRILLSICYEKAAERLSYVGNYLEDASAADGIMVEFSGSAAVSDSSGLGNYAGIGTGTIVSTSVAFTNLWIYYADPLCVHCFCNVCKTGTSPASITVEFSGVADGDCANCDTFNTTAFVLDRRNNSCQYTFARLWETVDCGDGMASPSESFYEAIDAFFWCTNYTTNDGAWLILRVRYQDYSSGSYVLKYAEFKLSLGCCKLDCAAALDDGYYGQGVDIPLVGVFTSSPAPTTIPSCDWTNATCTVTAVA